MMQYKKIGLLDMNESMEFIKLKEDVEKFMTKIKRAGGEQAFYVSLASRPFNAKLSLGEIEKIIKNINDLSFSLGKKDIWVAKELGQINLDLVKIKERLSKFS